MVCSERGSSLLAAGQVRREDWTGGKELGCVSDQQPLKCVGLRPPSGGFVREQGGVSEGTREMRRW